MTAPLPTPRTRRGALPAAIAVLALGGGLAAWLLARAPAAPRADRVVEDAGVVEPPRLAGRTARAAAKAADVEAAGAAGSARTGHPAGPAADTIEAPKLVRTIPLTVRVLDPETGAPVPSRWSLRSWLEGPHTLREGLGDGRPLLPTPPEAVTDALFRASGEAGAREIEGGGRLVDVVAVRAPQDRVYLERTLTAVLAADAVRANVVVPAWREVPLEVQVVDEAGRPLPDSEIVEVLVAGSGVAVHAEGVGPGLYRVRGIPHLAGESVECAVRAPASRAPTAAAGVEDAAVDLRTHIERTTVPADRSAPWGITVVLPPGEPTGVSFSEHNETDNDLPIEESLGRDPDEDKGPRGSIAVRLLGPTGSPIVGGVVWLSGFGAMAVSGPDGAALLERVRVGEQLAFTKLDGRFPISASVTVRAGARAEVVLKEPVGATIDLIVVDPEDHPVPFADFLVQGGLVFDVRDGDQRLDAYVDEHGRRTLARVEPGRLTVQAARGGRSGTTTFTARDGERRTVYVVLD